MPFIHSVVYSDTLTLEFRFDRRTCLFESSHSIYDIVDYDAYFRTPYVLVIDLHDVFLSTNELFIGDIPYDNRAMNLFSYYNSTKMLERTFSDIRVVSLSRNRNIFIGELEEGGYFFKNNFYKAEIFTYAKLSYPFIVLDVEQYSGLYFDFTHMKKYDRGMNVVDEDLNKMFKISSIDFTDEKLTFDYEILLNTHLKVEPRMDTVKYTYSDLRDVFSRKFFIFHTLLNCPTKSLPFLCMKKYTIKGYLEARLLPVPFPTADKVNSVSTGQIRFVNDKIRFLFKELPDSIVLCAGHNPPHIDHSKGFYGCDGYFPPLTKEDSVPLHVGKSFRNKKMSLLHLGSSPGHLIISKTKVLTIPLDIIPFKTDPYLYFEFATSSKRSVIVTLQNPLFDDVKAYDTNNIIAVVATLILGLMISIFLFITLFYVKRRNRDINRLKKRFKMLEYAREMKRKKPNTSKLKKFSSVSSFFTDTSVERVHISPDKSVNVMNTSMGSSRLDLSDISSEESEEGIDENEVVLDADDILLISDIEKCYRHYRVFFVTQDNWASLIQLINKLAFGKKKVLLLSPLANIIRALLYRTVSKISRIDMEFLLVFFTNRTIDHLCFSEMFSIDIITDPNVLSTYGRLAGELYGLEPKSTVTLQSSEILGLIHIFQKRHILSSQEWNLWEKAHQSGKVILSHKEIKLVMDIIIRAYMLANQTEEERANYRACNILLKELYVPSIHRSEQEGLIRIDAGEIRQLLRFVVSMRDDLAPSLSQLHLFNTIKQQLHLHSIPFTKQALTMLTDALSSSSSATKLLKRFLYVPRISKLANFSDVSRPSTPTLFSDESDDNNWFSGEQNEEFQLEDVSRSDLLLPKDVFDSLASSLF
ncbi:hypothetical protein PCE1_004805 [Barthelona sp. PCE]